VDHYVVPTSSRHRQRYLFSLILALVGLFTVAAPACSSSSNVAAGLAAEEACHQNSDCARALFCALGACRAQCAGDADCGSGGRCIDNGDVAVCQYADENDTPCTKESDCPEPLACASDYRCRNLCATAADCNVLGISGRVCAKDANGYDYCAVPAEVSNGKITVSPPPGAMTGTPVIEPILDASVSDGATSSDGATVMTAGEGGPGMTGDAGGDASTLCTPVCRVGTQCVAGSCTMCGEAVGQPCCPTGCGANLTCSSGSCQCGAPGQSCCDGTTCSNGVTCLAGTCACGAAGEACCPASMDHDAGAACTTPLQCAGLDCTCIVACSGGLLQRSDGSLWNGATPVTLTTSTPLIATSFSSCIATVLSCAVDTNGSVWCWGTQAADGQLGNGAATASASPVQVVTAPGGPALSNATKVFVDAYNGDVACAVDASTKLWCWGYGAYGVLGTGYTNNSNVATPVLTTSGGSQFSGVDQVAVTGDHACARKTDGTLWCWGSNATGQIGTGSSSVTSYPYPTQVQSLFGNVVNVSVSGLGQSTGETCATTTDGGVWCWGSNARGILANGLETGQATEPVQVMTAVDGGAPFSGAAQVEILSDEGFGACILKASDRSLWCWGLGGNAPFVPTPYTENAFPVTGVFSLCENNDTNGSHPMFFDGTGVYHSGGGVGAVPTCP
jgi:alpha-tubulin suppressor-like RCC1 family protein